MIGILRATGCTLCIAALTLAVIARDNPIAAPASHATDPVCGFAFGSRPLYFDEDPHREGLDISLAVPSNSPARTPMVLRFYVRRQPGDLAVDNLQLEHERFMHVIGVRDDLDEFFHVHPTKVSPGVWQINLPITNGGNYKIWSDVRVQDVSYAVGHPAIRLPGGPGQPASRDDRDRPDYEVRSGHQITFKHTEPLLSGNSASLQFLVRDAAGREIELTNFLGAPMHLVVIKDDLTVYRHAHPDPRSPSQPAVTFTQDFPTEGRYKLFAQFRPAGTTLAPDDAILAEFYVNVSKGPPTTAAASQK